MQELIRMAALVSKHEAIEKARWSKVSDWNALKAFCNGRHLNDAIYDVARRAAIREMKEAA